MRLPTALLLSPKYLTAALWPTSATACAVCLLGQTSRVRRSRVRRSPSRLPDSVSPRAPMARSRRARAAHHRGSTTRSARRRSPAIDRTPRRRARRGNAELRAADPRLAPESRRIGVLLLVQLDGELRGRRQFASPVSTCATLTAVRTARPDIVRQHRRQRDLHDDQHRSAALTRRPGARAAGGELAANVGAGQMQRRRKREHQAVQRATTRLTKPSS